MARRTVAVYFPEKIPMKSIAAEANAKPVEIKWVDRQGLGPVASLRHDAAAGGRRITDAKCVARSTSAYFGVANVAAGLAQPIKSQAPAGEVRHAFEQRLVQRHVEGRRQEARLQQKPGIHFQ